MPADPRQRLPGSGNQKKIASEVVAYTEFINRELQDDEDVAARLPIEALSSSLTSACQDGALLVKLVHLIDPTVISLQMATIPAKNRFHAIINLNLVIKSVPALGITLTNIGATDIYDQKLPLVLGLLWQLIQVALLRRVSAASASLFKGRRGGKSRSKGKAAPQDCPGQAGATLSTPGDTAGSDDEGVGSEVLALLLGDDVESTDVSVLPPDKLLLKWLNFHLGNSRLSDRVVNNFGQDLQDGTVYAIVLNQIAADTLTDIQLHAVLTLKDVSERAERIIACVAELGCDSFCMAAGIVAGNPRLNLALVASLFTKRPHIVQPPHEAIVELQTQTADLAQANAGLESSNAKLRTALSAALDQVEARRRALTQVQASLATRDSELDLLFRYTAQLQQRLRVRANECRRLRRELQDTRHELSTTRVEAETRLTTEQERVQQVERRLEQIGASIEHVGWLMRLTGTGLRGRFRRCYCVLVDSSLRWYKDKSFQGQAPEGLMDTSKIARIYAHSQHDEAAPKLPRSHPFGFSIQDDQGTSIVFACITQEEQHLWRKKIQKAKANALTKRKMQE